MLAKLGFMSDAVPHPDDPMLGVFVENLVYGIGKDPDDESASL